MPRSIQRTNAQDASSSFAPFENSYSWQVGNRQINLLKEGNKLIYEVFEDRISKRRDYISSGLVGLYGMTRALKLIDIFYDVIQINLSNYISSQAFLPVLCTDGFIEKREDNKKYLEATNLQIALFGQFTLEDTSRKVIGAIWGIFNPQKKTSCVQVDDRNFEVVSTFLQNVPLVSGEAEYAKYAKRFKPILADNKATCIFLRYISIYDSNVTLDENNWSVTILSAHHRSGLRNVGFSNYRCGHSMLAIEGIENRDSFIRYAHITTNRVGDDDDDDRKPNQARVEIIRDRIINNVSPGITLRLPKNRLIKLLENIEKAQNAKNYVDFAMDRNIISLVASGITGGGTSVVTREVADVVKNTVAGGVGSIVASVVAKVIHEVSLSRLLFSSYSKNVKRYVNFVMNRNIVSLVAGGVAGGVGSGVAGIVANRVAGVVNGIASGMASSVVAGIVNGVTSGIASGVVGVMASGIADGIADGVVGGVERGVAIVVSDRVASRITDVIRGAAVVAIGGPGGVEIAVILALISGMAGGVSGGVVRRVNELFLQSLSTILTTSSEAIVGLLGVEGFVIMMREGLLRIYQLDNMGRIRNRFHNCTSWVIEQLEEIRIEFSLTRRQRILMTPNGLIKKLNSGEIQPRVNEDS